MAQVESEYTTFKYYGLEGLVNRRANRILIEIRKQMWKESEANCEPDEAPDLTPQLVTNYIMLMRLGNQMRELRNRVWGFGPYAGRRR